VARIFCLPFAGTGAGLLRQWPAQLGDVELCRVQLPGRENRIREPPWRDFESFAHATTDGLAPYLDRPYALFGHCMGALLAHRLAVRLRELPVRPPSRLIVSSSLPPHFPPAKRYRPPTPGAIGVYHPAMSDDELAEEMRRVARAQGQSDILPELLPLAVRVLRCDLDACYSYTPTDPVPVHCPITTIGWTQDPEVAPAEMTAWRDYGQLTPHTLEGDKLSFIRAPRALMTVLAEDCADIATESGERT
jgi:surfactin synthase thioesterase subunit